MKVVPQWDDPPPSSSVEINLLHWVLKYAITGHEKTDSPDDSIALDDFLNSLEGTKSACGGEPDWILYRDQDSEGNETIEVHDYCSYDMVARFEIKAFWLELKYMWERYGQFHPHRQTEVDALLIKYSDRWI